MEYKIDFSGDNIKKLSLEKRSKAHEFIKVEDPQQKVDLDVDPMNSEIKDSIYGELSARIGNGDHPIEFILEKDTEFPFWFAHFFICETDLLEQYLAIGTSIVSVDYIRSLAIVLSANSDIAIKTAFIKGLWNVVIFYLTSGKEELIHAVFKLVRRIVINSHFGRIALCGLKFFNFCQDILNDLSEENKRYLARTCLRFCILEPIFGKGGYSEAGGSLEPRKDVLNDLKPLLTCLIDESVPGREKALSKRYIELSNYIRKGSVYSCNKPLWHILGELILSHDVRTAHGAVGALQALALRTEDGAECVVAKTPFFSILNEMMKSEVDDLIFAGLSMLCTITSECEEDVLSNVFNRLPFLVDMGLFFAQYCVEDASKKEIRVMATRFLANIVTFKHEYAMKVGSKIAGDVVTFCSESEFEIRIENVWLLLDILYQSDDDQKAGFMNEEILDMLSDFIDGDSVPLTEAILNLLCIVVNDLDDEVVDFIGQHDIMEKIHELNEDSNQVFVLLSQFIIEQVEELQEDDECD